MAETLVLIDLSGIAHPLWHVNDGAANPNATSIAIVERIRALASAHRHVAICCDSGKSFRAEIDASYKAQRPESDARLHHQITLAVETLRGDGFPIWAVKGFEADDLIATAVHLELLKVTNLDDSVLVVSPDKDLRQLVNSRVSVLAPAIADRPSKTYDVAAVIEKHGVAPNQLLDYFSLVGDTSDNITGAKGIGAVTAAKLINTFGNLDDLYAAIDKGDASIKPAGLASLAEFRPRMETVRSLIRLRTDAPIPFEDIFVERVPQDVAVFGGEEMDESHAGVAEVEDALGQTEEVAGPEAGTPAKQDATLAGSNPAAGAPRTELVVSSAPAPTEWERGLEPRSMDEAVKLADRLMASRLFSAYGHPAGILATVLAGRELGIQAMASLRAFHIIEGKPTLSAGAIVALIMKSGKAEYFRPVERTAEQATFVTKRHGDPEVMMTFTIDEARQAWSKDAASFTKSAWGKHPADMCVARCSSKLARLVYPDVVFNLYAPEEFD